MKLAALALDYDGTISERGIPDPEVRVAIDELRGGGVIVLLVTGRILADLQRSAGDIRFVDAVVGENGGVLAFPNSVQRVLLAQPQPPGLLSEVRRRGIEADAGECILETDASNAPAILEIIRELELPLVLLFNRERLMVLPQGVSKATGLHAALRLFGLSEHNTMGIGDAENDHSLLEACEIGVAVEWGSPALKAVACDIAPGKGPRDLAVYIRAAGAAGTLPMERSKRRLPLGRLEDGQPLEVPIRGESLLIVGDSSSGKSWVAGSICEQLVLQRYSVCVIDPEGDHSGLTALPTVVTLGGQSEPPDMAEVRRLLRHPEVSAVLDLAKLGAAEKERFVTELLPELEALRRQVGIPHYVVLDEAHKFLSREAPMDLVEAARSGHILSTYRLSELHSSLRTCGMTTIATRLTDAEQLHALCDEIEPRGGSKDWRATLASLATSEAALVRGSQGAPVHAQRFRPEPRLTSHVRHRSKYLDVAVPEAVAFVFTRDGLPVGARARTMRELAALVQTLDGVVLREHLQRGDVSRWISDVYRDETLAHRTRVLERLSGYEALSDLRRAIARLVEERYGLSDDSSSG